MVRYLMFCLFNKMPFLWIDTLESVSNTIHDMMKKIFTEDDQGVVKEFLEINKERTQAYL